MKSNKKRCKELLALLKQAAEQLLLVSSELTLLASVQKTASKIISDCDQLTLELSAVKKSALSFTIAESSAWASLEELLDLDLISQLEEQLFKLIDNHAEQPLGEFLQQLLAKIERSFIQIINFIQEITDLLEQE